MGTGATRGAKVARSGRSAVLLSCLAGLLSAGCVGVRGTDDHAVFGEFSLRNRTRGSTPRKSTAWFVDGMYAAGGMDATVSGTFGEYPDTVDLPDTPTSGDYGAWLVEVGRRHTVRDGRGMGLGVHYGFGFGSLSYVFDWEGVEYDVSAGYAAGIAGVNVEINCGRRARIVFEGSILKFITVNAETCSVGLEFSAGDRLTLGAAYRMMRIHTEQETDIDYTLRGFAARMVYEF